MHSPKNQVLAAPQYWLMKGLGIFFGITEGEQHEFSWIEGFVINNSVKPD
jgi:hypothetical protein